MAETNIANKKFTCNEVLGDIRMEMVEFTIPNGTVGSIIETRLKRIIAFDLAGQDVQRRNGQFLANTPNGGNITTAAWAGGAGDNNKRMILEVWGY